MRRISLPQIILIVAWGNVVFATIPHLLVGPLRPFPLGQLCWVISAAVFVMGLSHRGDETPFSDRAIVVGLLTGLTVGIISGTQGWVSIFIALVIIGLVSRGLQTSVALVAFTVVSLGFLGRIIGNGTPPPNYPAWTTFRGANGDTARFNPNAVMNPTHTAQWASALAYGETLFADVDTAAGWADEQRLTTTGGPGPKARIWPEPHAYLNDPVVLVPSKISRARVGRIVARIWVDDNDPANPNGYPQLGLRPGMNYLWVDSLQPVPLSMVEDFRSPWIQAAVSLTARAVLIPADGSPPRTLSMMYQPDPTSRLGTRLVWANHSRAEWIYGEQGDGLLVSCAMAARCRLPSRGGGAP